MCAANMLRSPAPAVRVLCPHGKRPGAREPADLTRPPRLTGTLGIFHGAALALRGRRVAVVERGKLQGREQEWNISRSDMQARPLACAHAYCLEMVPILGTPHVANPILNLTRMAAAELNKVMNA